MLPVWAGVFFVLMVVLGVLTGVHQHAESQKNREARNAFMYDCLQRDNSPARCSALWEYRPR